MASGHVKIVLVVLLSFIPYAYSYETTREMVIYTALKAGNEMGKHTTYVSTDTISYHEPMNVSGKTCVFLSRQEIQELANREGRIQYFEFGSYTHMIIETTVWLNHLTMYPEGDESVHWGYEGTKYTIFYDIMKDKWVYRSTDRWVT